MDSRRVYASMSLDVFVMQPLCQTDVDSSDFSISDDEFDVEGECECEESYISDFVPVLIKYRV
jgi:hypothetical protein